MAPFVLTIRLLARFWPQLLAIVSLGIVAINLFLWIAAKVALLNPMAGLTILTLVVLAQLVTTVAMFQVLRPGLPSIAAAQAQAGREAGSGHDRGPQLVTLIGITLLPFFLYYAAWGFLGDTVRQYSRLALEMTPFGESGNVLNVVDSRWLIVSIGISWLVRAFAKRRLKRRENIFWQIVVVVCETNWIFIGLYVISRWQESFFAWIGNGGFWQYFEAATGSFVSPAHAGTMVPVEQSSAGFGDILLSLFWFMLLPVIWLVLTAIVYGYDIGSDAHLRAQGRTARIGERYKALPIFIRDFIESFIDGYRSRYLPVANGVRMTLGSGVVLIATLIVGYRLIDWGAAWLWLGAVRVIGQQPAYLWDVLPDAISFFFGSQFQDSSLSIIVEPVRICFLAAVLEVAFLPVTGAKTAGPVAGAPINSPSAAVRTEENMAVLRPD
ncbi:hypothetical protein [Rhizobium binxianense]